MPLVPFFNIDYIFEEYFRYIGLNEITLLKLTSSVSFAFVFNVTAIKLEITSVAHVIFLLCWSLSLP